MKYQPGVLCNRTACIKDRRTEEGCYKIEINLGEDAGATIYVFRDGSIALEEIPQYGGEPKDYGFYTRLFEVLEEVNKWT